MGRYHHESGATRRLLRAGRLVVMPLCAWASLALGAHAAENYASGHIINVAFAGDIVLIILDAPVPDNCVGTPYGWMVVPATSKPMIAFVLGLWMRGDSGSTRVTVYTDGLVGSHCYINQIDPAD